MKLLSKALFYWILNPSFTPAPKTFFLLQEDGFLLLQENGDRIIIGVEAP